MKKITLSLILLFLLIPALSLAEGRPHWSFGLRGGYFVPDIDGWEDQYGEKGAWLFGLEGGWKITRQLELNSTVGYSSAEGKALTVSGRPSSDKLTFRQMPINVSLIYRMVFSENQVVVPYVGGGYSHVFYWQELGDQEFSGDRYGYHARGGLQFLLDALDLDSARDIQRQWGVDHSYFVIEGLYSKVDDFGNEDIDIGGWGILGGFLLEF